MNLELANKHGYFSMSNDEKVSFWVNNISRWLRFYGPYSLDLNSIDEFCGIMCMFYPKMQEIDKKVDSILERIIMKTLNDLWTVSDKSRALSQCLKQCHSIKA